MTEFFAAEPPLFWLLAVLAVTIAGFSKASTGGGVAVMAVPLMALAIPAPRAAAIMLPLLCVMDLLGLWAYRGKWNNTLLKLMLPGAMFGILLGTLVFGIVDARWVKGLLGLECIAFSLHRLIGRRQNTVQIPVEKAGWVRATWWSTISGFTSALAHAGGPPLMQFLLSLKIDKLTFVATSVTFFSIVNYVKLVPYGYLGLFDFSNLRTSLLLATIVPVGYWLGLVFARRIPEKPFFTVVTWMLLVTGLKLLWDGLFGG